MRKVLDHGFVRLVSYMQPVQVPPYAAGGDPAWTGDLEIVRNARVSYDADWRTGESEANDEKLLRSLHRRGHTSPFEAMVFTFEVKAPIFVFRQWHRHRTWSYNELSARYAPMNEDFYVPRPEHVGVQGKKDKQVREMNPNDVNAVKLAETHEIFVARLGVACRSAYGEYQMALANGIPRELARLMLPLNMYSRMFATVDLHNLFHFLRLRLDKHAQYEIRVYAQAILELIQPICPIAVDAFEKELPDEGTPFNPIKVEV